MENKGKKKSSSRNDISLDQAILQWIVDDYDISDEKSRKIVGKSGEKSKLITRKMVMNYLDNRGVLEETDETEFMRSLRKRLYYAIDTVVGPIPMKSKSINVSMEELIEGDEYQKKNTMEIDGYQNLKESQKKLLKDIRFTIRSLPAMCSLEMSKNY